MVTEEWDQNMIVGIYLTSDSTECEQPAFERTWAGTSRYEYREPMGGSRRGKGKEKQRATPPITASIFKDEMTICLIRGAQSWSDAFTKTGKSFQNANCADGLVPCAKGAMQTLCVNPEKVETDCPITDVRLVYDKDFNAEQLKDYKKAKI